MTASGYPGLDSLREAHQEGLGEIAHLEEVAGSLLGESPGSMDRSLRFFYGELEQHFREEEQVLFPALARRLGWEGMLRAMLDEHVAFWKAVEALEEAAQEPQRTANIARHIVWLLRSHIQKEEQMVLPLAEKMLSPGELVELGKRGVVRLVRPNSTA